MPAELRWSRTRQPFFSSNCCPPNIVRTVAESGNYAYSLSKDGVWVNLYGGSVFNTRHADGAALKLTQETDYPWDGRVRITLDIVPAAAFSVRLRVPGWAVGAAMSVNGTPAGKDLRPGFYHEVRRVWSAGDVLELRLPMRAQLLQAHPFVEEARNQVAVKRGPLVYCLESTDLPRGVAVSEVVLPRRIALQPRHDGKFVGGVTVLEGKAEAVAASNWGKELYRQLDPDGGRAVELKLIPYYAWGNRGRSEMTVWLLLGR
jgi:DUF1680 family protein